MNKYSSKAIKTAATVGMSLAMVLSAVPATPVFADYAVSVETNVLTNAWSDFKSDVLTLEDLKTITSETEISKDDYNNFMKAAAEDPADLTGFTPATGPQNLFDLLEDTSANTFGKIVADSVTKLTGEVRAYVKEMQTIYTKVTEMTGTTLGGINAKLLTDGAYADNNIADNINDAIADLEALDEFEADYYNNLTAAQQETFDTVKGKLNSQVSSVAGTDYDTKLSAYVKELTKAYEEFVKENQGGTVTKPMVNSVLSWIKDGKALASSTNVTGSYTTITKANYKRFADYTEVETMPKLS